MEKDESANFCGAMAVNTKIAEETLYSCNAGISHPISLTALLQLESDLHSDSSLLLSSGLIHNSLLQTF